MWQACLVKADLPHLCEQLRQLSSTGRLAEGSPGCRRTEHLTAVQALGEIEEHQRASVFSLTKWR